MRKRMSLLITSLLASGMFLGTVGLTTNTVRADETAISQSNVDKEVSNTVTYYYNGEQIGDQVQVKGTYNEPITQAPKGYYVSEFKIFLQDDSPREIQLGRDDGKITNYIAFKNYNGETPQSDSGHNGIGKVVRGNKVGDTVNVGSDNHLLISYENGSDPEVVLGEDKTVQNVIVRDAGGVFNGVVRVTNPDGAEIVDRKWNHINRKLPKGSEWKTFDQVATWSEAEPRDLVLYRVAPNQYIWSADSEIISYTPTNPAALEGVIRKSYRKVVTTKNKIVRLYREDGTIVGNRALGSKTAWKSDLMVQKDGSLMFRVATTEWVKVSDLD